MKNLKQLKRESLEAIAEGSLSERTLREKKRIINATLKHWAYLGEVFIPSPDFRPGIPGVPAGMREMHLNATHSVMIFDAPGGVTHLMVRRHDEGKEFPWYALQNIKNRFCGPERVGVEVFPAQSELVDDANIRHLWVYPAEYRLPFGL